MLIRRVGRKEQSHQHLVGVPTARKVREKSSPWHCSRCSAFFLRVSPEASQRSQDGFLGRGADSSWKMPLVVLLGTSWSTGMVSSHKGGPTSSRSWAARLSWPSLHLLRMPEETVTWNMDHTVLDMCNYSLLTCNYSRSRHLSISLLYIMQC